MYKFIDAHGEHLHTFNDKPLIGTTTLIKEVYPPMLSWYGSGKALEIFGWLNSKLATEEERLRAVLEPLQKLQELPAKDFLALLDKAYKNHNEFKKAAGKKGTDTHAKVEIYIKECLKNKGGTPLDWPTDGIQDFIDWAKKDVKKFLWSEGYCYSEELWVGGCSDFGFLTHDDLVIIADYKTAKDIYWTNFLQCAAYGIQAKENGIFTDEGKKLGHPKKIDGYMIFQQKENGKAQIKWQYCTEELEQAFRGSAQVYNLMQEFKNN